VADEELSAVKSLLEKLFEKFTGQATLWTCATCLISVRLATLPSLHLQESFWWLFGLFGTAGFALAMTSAGQRETAKAVRRRRLMSEMAKDLAQLSIAAVLIVLLSTIALGLVVMGGAADLARGVAVFGLLVSAVGLALVFPVVVSFFVWLRRPDRPDGGTDN